MENKIVIKESYFTEKETDLVINGKLKASLFIYDTGVKAIKVANDKGYIIVLPYMGQMIWRANFNGRELTMKTPFDQPIPAKRSFEETYGCFLMHCGLTAMGNPTSEDTHIPHGELPICKYDEVYIISGEDENGKYMGVTGKYVNKLCYGLNYEFTPVAKIYEGKTKIDIVASFVNNKDVPLEYYYLCHINHRPVNGAKLSYTADRKTFKVNHEVPEDYFNKEAADKTNAYLDMLDKDQSLMDDMGAEYQSYAPEIVFYGVYNADENGNAYTMQIDPEGTAIYVIHKPEELPYGVRWISRTEDEDTLGMVLPATCEHLGRLYCQRNNQQLYLNKGERITYHMETGLLDVDEAKAMQDKIKKMGF